MGKEKKLQNLILFTYLILNLYYAYRYIFQYNSEGTSPTYSDTPLFFQLGKYIIIIAIFLVFFLYLLFNDVKIDFRTEEIVIIFSCVFIFILSIVQRSFDFLIKNYLCILPAYMIMFLREDSFNKRFFSINKFIFIYHIIFSFVQIFLYLKYDRLPALGYSGGLVRFGGGLDDPNSFGLYLIIPFCYLVYKIMYEKNVKRLVLYIVLLLICFVLELLTFSFAAYLAMFIAFLCLLIQYGNIKRFWKLFLPIALVVIIIAIIKIDKIIELIVYKSGSLSIHISELFLNVKNENLLLGLFLGDSSYTFSENYYNLIFQNYGVLYFLAIIWLTLHFLRLSYLNYKKDRTNTQNFIVFVFILAFVICQIGIPHSIIYPVNYIYWVACFICLRENRNNHRAKVGNSLKRYTV